MYKLHIIACVKNWVYSSSPIANSF